MQLLDPNSGLFVITNTGPSTIFVSNIVVPYPGIVTYTSFTLLSGEELQIYVTSYAGLSGVQVDVYTTCGNTSFNFPS